MSKKYLEGMEEKRAIEVFKYAAEIARKYAQCLSSHRGVVIEKDNQIIAHGTNGPPDGISCKTCLRKTIESKTHTEPCRAVHAEQEAIINAFQKGHVNLNGTRMYHIKVKNGEIVKDGGHPSCTICSKLVLRSGISEFALWEEKGVRIYTAKEFYKESLNSLNKYI